MGSHEMDNRYDDDIEQLRLLGKSINDNVETVVRMLEAKNLQPPALHAEAPSPDFVPVGDVKMHVLRREVIKSARLLADVFSGPRKHLMDLCTLPNHQAMAMQFLYRYNIAALVPLVGTISFATLSKETGLDESRMARMIRFMILHQIFQEPVSGEVAHTATSKLLATEKMSMDFLGHNCEDMLPACSHQVESMVKSPHGISVLDCGMAMALGDGKRSLFEIFNNDQTRLERFSGAMEFINARGAHPCVEDDLLINFDWHAAGPVKVVDVGGSQGYTSMYILRHAANVQSVVVQDLPLVIEQAEARGAPKDVADRLSFQSANFFEPQPVTDADIYLFRFIFHDWPYKEALAILKAQVPSMKSGARLVVNESILHDANECDTYTELVSRRMDLQMMVALNSKERSVPEWQSLVADATQGELKLEASKPTVLVFRKL